MGHETSAGRGVIHSPPSPMLGQNILTHASYDRARGCGNGTSGWHRTGLGVLDSLQCFSSSEIECVAVFYFAGQSDNST